MDGWRSERITVADGVNIAVHIRGEGRTALMLHGFLADTQINWISPGIADAVVAAGYRIFAMDLRGHGRSDAPTDAKAWPRDVLVDDGLRVIAALALDDYDLIGYSLGARTSARMLARGAAPRRAVLGGMGASGIMEAGARAEMFRDAILNGEHGRDPRAGRYIQAIIQQRGLNPLAMLGVLDSFAATTEADLRDIATPTLVVSGEADDDNGSPEELAVLLANGRAQRVPGNHLTAVSADLAAAIVGFLAAP